MKKSAFAIIPCLLGAAALAESTSSDGGLGFPIIVVIVIALIVAFIVLSKLKAQMKTAKHEQLAMNYVREGSFKLDVSQDIFLYQTEQRQHVPKQNNTK
ncbi:MAG: hypothetical protein IJA26_08495 [Clostridia bacterium]|nr:hypothetical protein [Clostridia bacterium]